jgi:hypothetical protein
MNFRDKPKNANEVFNKRKLKYYKGFIKFNLIGQNYFRHDKLKKMNISKTRARVHNLHSQIDSVTSLKTHEMGEFINLFIQGSQR